MTANFSDSELACPCGCGMLPRRSFMVIVQAIRDEAGFAFPVTSAARCSAYNQLVSSTGPNGPHTTGEAIDIGVHGYKAYQLIKLAMKYGITGIGVSQKGPREKRFIHLDTVPNSDTVPRPWVWTY